MTAEKDRIIFHNAPDKTPELFEKLLPVAMVMGVEKEWAKKFEDIYVIPPQWYAGGTFNHFSSSDFSHALGGFSSASSASFVSPRQSGSGGFGGGGFSGGGGGGGGGGSW